MNKEDKKTNEQEDALDAVVSSIQDELLIGELPQLNDVLRWHSLNGRDKYSHFEVNGGVGKFIVYDSDEGGYVIDWDLSKPSLHSQCDDLIVWLSELI